MTETSPFGKIVVKALAEHGYILGQNLTFDARGAMGDIAKLPALLQELKARDVDAIVVVGYPAALAAKSTGIPTVGANGLGDPVETRLIDSLAHPGGNITGISDVAATLTTKRLSLLKEIVAEAAEGRDALEQGRPRHVAALRGVGEGRTGDRHHGPGARGARARRFQRGLRGDERAIRRTPS